MNIQIEWQYCTRGLHDCILWWVLVSKRVALVARKQGRDDCRILSGSTQGHTLVWAILAMICAVLLLVRPCVAQSVTTELSKVDSLLAESKKAYDSSVAHEKVGNYSAAADDLDRTSSITKRLVTVLREFNKPEAAQAAEKYADRAHSQMLIDRAKASTDQVAEKLYNAGVASAQAHDLHSAVRYWQQALSLCRKHRLSNNEANTLMNLGRVSEQLEAYDRARSYFEEALPILHRLQMSKQEADTLVEIGNLRNSGKDYFKSTDRYEQALVIYRHLGLQKEEANTLLDLANLEAELGNYSKAATLYQQALILYEHLNMPKQLAKVLYNVGGFLLSSGNPGDAMDLHKKALAIFSRLNLPLEETETLNALGAGATMLRDHGLARGYLKQALAISRRVGLPEEEAYTLEYLGMDAEAVGDHDQASGYFKQSLDIYHRLGLQKEEASYLLNLGAIAENLHDPTEYKKATDYYARASAIFQHLLVLPLAREAELKRADGLLEQGQLSAALAVYRTQRADGLRFGRYYLAAGNPAQARYSFLQSLAIASKRRETSEVIGVLIGLSLSEERLGRISEAAVHSREAVNKVEEERYTMTTAERGRFIGGNISGFRRIEAYQILARCLMRLRRPDEAFRVSEHTKARASTEAVAGMASSSNLNISTTLHNQEIELADRASLLRERINDASGERTRPLREGLESALAGVHKEQEVLIEHLRREYPEYAAMKYPQPLHAGELALNLDEALLEFEVTDTQTIAFVVKGGKVIKSWTVPLTRKMLEQKVALFRRGMETIGKTHGTDGWRDFDPALAHELYLLLLEPALRLVGPREHLLVVPDGDLCKLPLEALVVDPPPAQLRWAPRRGRGEYPTGLHYVGDDRVLTYWQSGTSLTVTRRLRKEVPSNAHVLVVADPVYEKADKRMTGVGHATWQAPKNAVAIRGTEDDTFRRTASDKHLRLEDTGVFAEKLHSTIGADTLTGVDACESHILATSLDQYGLGVLFATHGLIDKHTPYLQQAAVWLSSPEVIGEPARVKIGNGPEHEINGYLTMSKIMDLHFRCELAGALGCLTGKGDVVAGEGTMHLGRAFQYAGCRSVLISLFEIEGSPTNMLSESLLSDMRNGVAKDDGILAARKKLLEAGYGHPLDWASFVLVGERDVVVRPSFLEQFERLVRTPAILSILLAIVMIGLWLVWRKFSRRTTFRRV